MSNLTIGILGGMGPRATVEFERRLLDSFGGSDQSLPVVVSVNDGSIPDRSDFLRGLGNDPLDALTRAARSLAAMRPDIVCMPCNTAHSAKILARLQAVMPLPVLDMPAACMLQVEALGLGSVLILGTAGTAASGIFNCRATTTNCLYPAVDTQLIVDQMIATLKQGRRPSQKQMAQLREVIEASDAEAAILACTELSLLDKKQLGSTPLFDSLDVLVTCCVNVAKGYTSK